MSRRWFFFALVLSFLLIFMGACFPRVKSPPITETVITANTDETLTTVPDVQIPPPPAIDLSETSATPNTVTLPAAPVSAACQATTKPSAPSSVWVNGLERSFITYVPENYNPSKPYPLIFAFHGRTSSNEEVRRYFGLESAMPEAIIVYPKGIWRGSGYTWANPRDKTDILRDYALFDEILRVMQEHYCIHEEKIFTVGHSLGAYFANDLACAKPDVIRAVASLAGGLQQKACSGEVSAMLLHNPEDRLVSIQEGRNALKIFTQTNHSNSARAVSSPLLQSFGCQRYDAKNDLILWCQHSFSLSYKGTYYPHNWPSQTAKAMSIFFNALP